MIAIVFGAFIARAQGKPAPARLAPTSGQGGQIFSTRCASCHGLDGHGGERAPDIAGSKEAQRLSDAELAKIIRDGLPGTGMPSFRPIGAAKIQAVVLHLRTLQGHASRFSLPGSPASGRALFFGKAGCSECHMVNGAGGFLGPDLSAYGRSKLPAELREIIVEPGKYLDDRGTKVVVTTPNGQTFTGIARNEDNFSLQLQTKDGTFHFFEKSSLRGIEHRSESWMPSDYGSRLNRQEINDLVSYLIEVGGAGSPQRNSDQPEQAEERE